MSYQYQFAYAKNMTDAEAQIKTMCGVAAYRVHTIMVRPGGGYAILFELEMCL